MLAREQTADVTMRPYNNLLRRLSKSDFALIAPDLVPEQNAAAGALLYNPGDDVEIVHFPCGPSLASYLVPNETAATSKPFWSAAKAPSAALSARVICRPIPASWSSSAARSCV